MLIEANSQPKVGDVVSLRLISGEELVARVSAISATHLGVSKPIAIQMSPMGNGEMGLGFIPFMVSVPPEAKFSLPLTSLLVAPLPARPDIAAKYQSMTSSIVAPPSGGVGSLLRG